MPCSRIPGISARAAAPARKASSRWRGWSSERLGSTTVAEGVRERLGGRVAVSAGNDRVFLYADTQEAAEEAARVAQDVLAERELEADLGLARWHPIAERWEEPSLPLPRTEAEREAEVDERE